MWIIQCSEIKSERGLPDLSSFSVVVQVRVFLKKRAEAIFRVKWISEDDFRSGSRNVTHPCVPDYPHPDDRTRRTTELKSFIMLPYYVCVWSKVDSKNKMAIHFSLGFYCVNSKESGTILLIFSSKLFAAKLYISKAQLFSFHKDTWLLVGCIWWHLLNEASLTR